MDGRGRVPEGGTQGLQNRRLVLDKASLHVVSPAHNLTLGWLFCTGLLTQVVVGEAHGHEVLGRPEVVHLVTPGMKAKLAG